MKAALVVNPQAGNHRAPDIADRAGQMLRKAGVEVHVARTTEPGEAEHIAAQLAADADVVVGVGGDGTLSELLNGLAESNTPCGMIPCGTGNDFARFVGIPDRLEDAVETIISGGPRTGDLALIKNHDRYFVNSIGVGFDAAVARRINTRRRWSCGLMAYLPAIAAELARPTPISAGIVVDGRELTGKWLLVAVANGSSYGAGFQIAPEAVVDDGLLDVVLVEAMGRLDVLRSLNSVRYGRHVNHPKVTMLKARSVRIETDRATPVLVDGDVRCETPLDIEVRPKAALLWI